MLDFLRFFCVFLFWSFIILISQSCLQKMRCGKSSYRSQNQLWSNTWLEVKQTGAMVPIFTSFTPSLQSVLHPRIILYPYIKKERCLNHSVPFFFKA